MHAQSSSLDSTWSDVVRGTRQAPPVQARPVQDNVQQPPVTQDTSSETGDALSSPEKNLAGDASSKPEQNRAGSAVKTKVQPRPAVKRDTRCLYHSSSHRGQFQRLLNALRCCPSLLPTKFLPRVGSAVCTCNEKEISGQCLQRVVYPLQFARCAEGFRPPPPIFR